MRKWLYEAEVVAIYIADNWGETCATSCRMMGEAILSQVFLRPHIICQEAPLLNWGSADAEEVLMAFHNEAPMGEWRHCDTLSQKT